MPAKRRWDEKNYQVTWEDVEPWLQQLEEEHNVYVRVTVVLAGVPCGMLPCVRVEFYRVGIGSKEISVGEDYRAFKLRSIGQVESLVLHMASTALLALDTDKHRQEQASLFA